jgi:type I restriction enzyme S subunit
MEASRVIPGDVLLNITGASIGRVCMVPSDLCPANVNQHVSIIRCDESICPAFLSYYISSPTFQEFIMSTQAGATRQALTKALIEEFRIPVPPVAEQQRIAATLSEQMVAVERAWEAAETRLEAVKSLAGSYILDAFGGAEAQRWPRVRLGDASELLPSKSIATDGDTEVQAITTACLTEFGFLPSGVKRARMWANDAAECVTSPGEVLVARSNTPELVGRASMFAGDPPGAVATDLTIRIKPRNGLRSSFLAGYLSFLYLTGYWKERAGGASGSMKKITRAQVQGERVPVPPVEVQERVEATLAEQIAAAVKARDAIEEEWLAITALPAALLRRAFSGAL